MQSTAPFFCTTSPSIPFALTGAAIAYCAMLWLHPILIGVDPKIALLSP